MVTPQMPSTMLSIRHFLSILPSHLASLQSRAVELVPFCIYSGLASRATRLRPPISRRTDKAKSRLTLSCPLKREYCHCFRPYLYGQAVISCFNQNTYPSLMIIDGAITYGNRGGDILNWCFSSDVVNELAISVLLTIISYQVAETVLNLFFGLKKQGQAKLSDIQIMLLIRQFSPISVVRTMISSKPKTGQRGGKNEEDEDLGETTRKEKAISLKAYIKLLTLLVAIPLINVGTVVLSLERKTTLTFAEGNFGGLAFGFDKNRAIANWTVLSRSRGSICNRTTLHTSTADFAVSQFSLCSTKISERNPPDDGRNNTFRVTVRAGTSERISVAVSVVTHRVEYIKWTMIFSRNATSSVSGHNVTLPEGTNFCFYLGSNLSEEDMNFMLRRGLELAKDHCVFEGEVQKARMEEREELTLSRIVRCRRDPQRGGNADRESAIAVASELLSFLSFVNSDTLRVRPRNYGSSPDPNDSQNFVSGQDLLLLKRQRGLASIPILAITAFGSILFRILSDLLTKNDLERGIGLIVRDGLELPCYDSMLCSPDVVIRYNRTGTVLHSIERHPSGFPGEEEGVVPSRLRMVSKHMGTLTLGERSLHKEAIP